MEILVELEH